MEDVELQDIDKEKDNDHDLEKEDPRYKGKVLMQRALDFLEDGNVEEFETNRKLANKYFDEANETDEEDDILYTENRNFGIIYRVFENSVPQLMETKSGKAVIRKFVQTIKNNKVLHEQFKGFNYLTNPEKKVNNVNDYVYEAIKLFNKLNINETKEENNKLIKIIKENKLNEYIDINDNDMSLYESIEYILTNEKKLNNIDEYLSHFNVISEAIEDLPIDGEIESLEKYYDELGKLSEKYGSELTDEELEFLKQALNGDTNKIFDEEKDKTIKLINDFMDKEEDMINKSRLSNVLKKVEDKEYSKDSAIIDISEMVEIQNTIQED